MDYDFKNLDDTDLYAKAKDSNGYWTECTDKKWSCIRKQSFKCFQDMGSMLHIFNCGSFNNEVWYHVIIETIKVTKEPSAQLFTMTAKEIAESFDININQYLNEYEWPGGPKKS